MTVNKHGIRISFLYQRARPSVARGTRFFAFRAFIINFKGVLIKLKIVALAIVEKNINFTIFWTFQC